MTIRLIDGFEEYGAFPEAKADGEPFGAGRIDPGKADIATMTLFDDYGKEDTLEISGLTISLSNTVLPLPPKPKIREGEHSVTGTIEVYFTGDQIFRWHRAAAAAMQNRMMRIARPHMGRRQFRRFRGMLLAQRRADWWKAQP